MKLRLTIFYLFVIIFGLLFANENFFYPRYKFLPTKPFWGKIKINPYQDVNLSNPEIINFHGHTHAWYGLTNGKHSEDEAKNRYKELGYSSSFLSQYHKIEKGSTDVNQNINIYEHGINLKKTHQLVIGSTSVYGRDFIFSQSKHQKQYILNQLSIDTSNIVVLNHPGIRNGYSLEDLKWLQNYDMIEAVRPHANFIGHWDTALAYGHPVGIMANDDFHDVKNDQEIGNCLMLVFKKGGIKVDILKSLREKCTIAAELNHKLNATLKERAEKIKRLKKLIHHLSLEDDTLSVSFSEEVEICWRGKSGLLKKHERCTNDKWVYPAQESYVRLEVKTKDSIVLYFNPIIRSENTSKNKRTDLALEHVKIDKTYQAAIISSQIVVFLFSLVFSWQVIIRKNK